MSAMYKRTPTLICKSTHIATPTVPVLDKRDEWIDICSTSSASSDNGIGDHWHRVFVISKGDIRSNCQRKGDFSLLEEGVALRYTSQR